MLYFFTQENNKFVAQSNLGYPDVDYPDTRLTGLRLDPDVDFGGQIEEWLHGDTDDLWYEHLDDEQILALVESPEQPEEVSDDNIFEIPTEN